MVVVMAEMSRMVINILLFSGIVVGISVFAFDMISDFADTSDVENIGTFNATREITETAEEMKTGIENLEINDVTDYLTVTPTIVGLGFALIKLFTQIPVVLITIIGQTAVILNIPDWAIGMAVAIVTIIVIFQIMKHINKTEP